MLAALTLSAVMAGDPGPVPLLHPSLWPRAVADLLIAVAFVSIPLAMYVLGRRRPELRRSRVMQAFSATFLVSGLAHAIAAFEPWPPDSPLLSILHLGSSALAMISAGLLWRLLPRLMFLPSPRQLAEANRKLSNEIAAREEQEQALKASEECLRDLSENLESKVAQRTAELAESNARLQQEVRDRQRMQSELQVLNGKLEEALKQEAVRSGEIEQLNKMGDLMQSCVSVQELAQVLANFAAGYLQAACGAVYLADESSDMLSVESSWGEWPSCECMIMSAQCWGLRRGQPHPADPMQRNLRCNHVSIAGEYVCLPLIANGETLGMLHLRGERGPHEAAFLDGVAKRAALAMFGLRAREALFNDATHDPLTSLFNRRYLDQALEDAARKAQRSNRPVGLMMIDLDHFKQINDAYGHEVGDHVLQEFANKLKSRLRNGDIACRYGGEEFTVLLTGASLAATRQRAEQFRRAVEGLRILHQGRLIKLTTSIGFAAFPDSGRQIAEVLHQADQALYRAKQGGRNRVAGPLHDGEVARACLPPEQMSMLDL